MRTSEPGNQTPKERAVDTCRSYRSSEPGCQRAIAHGVYDRLGMPAPFHVTVHQGRHIARPSILEVDAPSVGGIQVSGTAVPLEG